MNTPRIFRFSRSVIALGAFVVAGVCGFAQNTPASVPAQGKDGDIRELQDQVHQLRALVEEMRAENAQSRAEMHQLRQDLQATPNSDVCAPFPSIPAAA